MNDKKQFFLSTQLPLTVLLVLSLITCVQNARIAKKVENMQMRLNSVYSDVDALDNKFSTFEHTVDEALKKQNSLLSELSYEYGALNKEDNTVAVTLTAVPKTVTQDMQLSVLFDGQTAVFEKNGNEYVATLQAELFAQYDSFPVLSATSEGITKTEVLTSVNLSLLCNQYLPSLFCNLSGNETDADGNLNVVFGFSVSDAPASDIPFERFFATEERNGVKGEPYEITRTVREMQADTQSEHPECDFSLRLPLAKNECLNLHVSATDALGYVHTVIVTYENTENDDVPADISFGNEKIYDADGRLLFGIDKE
ncbi:MAG: hypothetical protein IJC45_03570 [Clostridia bacterium]|nr:hypothetical protein [Clostridia bacterium]